MQTAKHISRTLLSSITRKELHSYCVKNVAALLILIVTVTGDGGTPRQCHFGDIEGELPQIMHWAQRSAPAIRHQAETRSCTILFKNTEEDSLAADGQNKAGTVWNSSELYAELRSLRTGVPALWCCLKRMVLCAYVLILPNLMIRCAERSTFSGGNTGNAGWSQDF